VRHPPRACVASLSLASSQITAPKISMGSSAKAPHPLFFFFREVVFYFLFSKK